jgi:hypothetical protein
LQEQIAASPFGRPQPGYAHSYRILACCQHVHWDRPQMGANGCLMRWVGQDKEILPSPGHDQLNWKLRKPAEPAFGKPASPAPIDSLGCHCSAPIFAISSI